MTEQQSPTAAAASAEQMPAVESRLHGMDEFTGKVRDMAAEWEADWNDPFPLLAQAYSLIKESHPEAARLTSRAYWMLRRA
jgi:hypothetical protein